jgi:hypothetical protein
MAVTYTYDGTEDTIEIDFTNQEINVGPGFDDVDVQELNDAIREAEASAAGCGFGSIAETSGKADLDAVLGVSVGITLSLLGNWTVYTEKTSGNFKVWGGNLLRADGGDPLKANTLVHQFVLQSAASTIVQVSTGSGLSAAENAKLMGLPDSTLETDEREALINPDPRLIVGGKIIVKT